MTYNYIVKNVKINLEEHPKDLGDFLPSLLRIKPKQIKGWKIKSKSIDARKKDKEGIYIVYSFIIEATNRIEIDKRAKHTLEKWAVEIANNGSCNTMKKPENPPIVIGFGPAGIFAALKLAQAGLEPRVFERGERLEDRVGDVKEFWEKGLLNGESNVQFGEGGAGTFSDGKLTTRTNSPINDEILRCFVKFGAPEEILYLNKPHIGTDKLRKVIVGIRKHIESLGGKIMFNSKVTDIIVVDGKAIGVEVNEEEKYQSNDIIAATGHSAGDIYKMFIDKGMFVEPKGFAIGLRIEHLREMIDKTQYGKYRNNPILGAASYQLAYRDISGRGVYSFCMCPGGEVVGASSEVESIVVNGMSYHERKGKNSNSAIVVTINPDDYGNTPEKALEFAAHWEKRAYVVGGGCYKAPIQTVGDFLQRKKSVSLGEVEPTYRPGTTFSDLEECLPGYVTDPIRNALTDFNKKIEGFSRWDSVLTGVETRTSAPVRVTRNNQSRESINISNLYPTGEGAGYAGGIISAAVDGIKTADAIIENYKIKQKIFP
ncbi:NAD(P)/FAD-dependent oxidoreductase [Alkalibacter saccharofermentans]|uniref:FAD/NAD(P)-binding domain-containing protein n=1 Tax=Alkalibacter saccharofermentans DSM 14828 TaxID=1120975 RepID=A0A1M4VSX2_9FIRM|nr:FAD-dependent oxidoreductase [Alkalibacter saccharofermentans]SHE72221.1 hypothetical protein SAMN02746064_01050 [Alkalibacter saccharofermentans DSM 14828]